MLGITLARGSRQCCRLPEIHKIMNRLGVECHRGLFLLYSVLQFIFYSLHCLPKSQGNTRFHQTQQSTTAAPENINADSPPHTIEDWFISELGYIVWMRVHVCVCLCIQQQTHWKIKAELEGERGGGEREAHYNQAIMLAELEVSLFSLVAAWVWRRFFKWLQPNPWMWLTILC